MDREWSETQKHRPYTPTHEPGAASNREFQESEPTQTRSAKAMTVLVNKRYSELRLLGTPAPLASVRPYQTIAVRLIMIPFSPPTLGDPW